jgi:hypothetical protein
MTGKTAGSTIPTSSSVATSARREVRRSVETMLSEFAGQTATLLRTTASDLPGMNTVSPEPIAAIEAARAIEQASHVLLKDLIRLAREAGRSWYEIGGALDLYRVAVFDKVSVAEVAYDYALSFQNDRLARTFTWTCPACGQLITDQSPFRDFPDQEEGHAEECARWTAELAEWRRLSREKRP